MSEIIACTLEEALAQPRKLTVIVTREMLERLEKQLAERDATLARCVEALGTIELEQCMIRVDPPMSEDELMAKFEAISELAGNTIESVPDPAQATAKVQQWQPIETAPKDKRILLGWVESIFTGINCVIGRWENDLYAKKPRPYWTHDMERITSVSGARRNQPTHWMPRTAASACGSRPPRAAASTPA